jgi:hypothetical protein
MTTTYIYALIDPRDGAIRYVGKSDHPHVRFFQHMNDSGGSRRKGEWIESLKSLSLKPEVKILAEVDSEDCFQEEKSWIKRMIDNGCDLVNGNMGRGGTGTAKMETNSQIDSITAIPVRMTPTLIARLDEQKIALGLSTRADVIRWLIDNAHIRRASVQFPQPEKDKATA